MSLPKLGARFIDAVSVGDLDGLGGVLEQVSTDQLALWLAGEITNLRARLVEQQKATNTLVAMSVRAARREERAAAIEVRAENADLVKANERLRARLKKLAPIEPAGMSLGRAFEIACEAEERNWQ